VEPHGPRWYYFAFQKLLTFSRLYAKVKNDSISSFSIRMLHIQEGVDKSLVRPTSRCSRTESGSVAGKRGLFICRIVSIFLLQRLKGSMSGDAHDFNNMETRPVINFFFSARQGILTETLGEHASSYAAIKNWVSQFKLGNFSTCHSSRPGRPKQ